MVFLRRPESPSFQLRQHPRHWWHWFTQWLFFFTIEQCSKDYYFSLVHSTVSWLGSMRHRIRARHTYWNRHQSYGVRAKSSLWCVAFAMSSGIFVDLEQVKHVSDSFGASGSAGWPQGIGNIFNLCCSSLRPTFLRCTLVKIKKKLTSSTWNFYPSD